MIQCNKNMRVADLYIIGIERTAFKYRGLLLKVPTTLPKGN